VNQPADRIGQFLRRHRLPARGQSVLVAVSGGVDSMILLHLLHEASRRHRWRLVVAHFNHRLRGRSSDADERLVRDTARRLGVPCVAERADVRGFARQHRLSIEMAARRLRHEFLAHAARERGIRAVALAHHADDQAELFLLRLLRGAGAAGLSGMKPQSPSPAARGVRLIRPLLECAKEELRALARSRGLAFREDASNASPDPLRNRVRLELIPLLRRRYQPALTKVLLREMELLGAEDAALNAIARRWLRRPDGPFARLPVALQRRCLQLQLLAGGVAPDFEHIEELRRRAGREVMLAPDRIARRNGQGRIEFLRKPSLAFLGAVERHPLRGAGGALSFGGCVVRWRTLRRAGATRPAPAPGCEWFDADRVGAAVTLRHWQPGDRFEPIGLGRAARLQDLFTNARVPAARRRRLLVAVAHDGDIFWVEGLRIGERFKLTAQTRRRLRWEWRRSAQAD
jgi:tRNA(Ile)-lysidine synthase